MKRAETPSIIPIIEVVYRSKSDDWRGFCVPFDIACTATTSHEAKVKLDELVSLYVEGLRKYNFPKHLVNKKITDSEDKKVFRLLWPKIQEEIEQDIRQARAYQQYREFLDRQKQVFSVSPSRGYKPATVSLSHQLAGAPC